MGIEEFSRFEWLETGPIDVSGINENMGPMKSDLFASRLTHQLPKLVSWKPDPIAIHSDAFSLDWASLRGYSPSVASTTLDPILLHLCIDRPLLFPTSPKLLRDNIPQPLSNLQLAGWRLSADVTMTQAFQSHLEIFFWLPSERTQPTRMPPLEHVG